MKEFEVYVPLNYNDGTKVEQKKIDEIEDRLVAFFDGVTFFPHKNKGIWKCGDMVFRDDIVIYRAISKRPRAARKFLNTLKKWLKSELGQLEILIVVRDVGTI